MFVQVIEARVRDAEGLNQLWQRWKREMAADAVGWLGSTAGTTDDGVFVAAVRFESAEAAAQNSARPEQGRWWAETEKALDEVTFTESSDTSLTGSPDDGAGFVQLMRGRVSDRRRMEELEAEFEALAETARPDLLGGYTIWLPQGAFVGVNYFTSEAEARAGESKELPEDMTSTFGEWQALLRDVRWYDLADPWLDSPT